MKAVFAQSNNEDQPDPAAMLGTTNFKMASEIASS
jgi:hypothetical protein